MKSVQRLNCLRSGYREVKEMARERELNLGKGWQKRDGDCDHLPTSQVSAQACVADHHKQLCLHDWWELKQSESKGFIARMPRFDPQIPGGQH